MITRVQALASALLLLLLLVACAPKVATSPTTTAQAPPPESVVSQPAAAPGPAVKAPATPAWQEEWERVLAEAKREGKVMLGTALGAEPRTALVQGLAKAHGISVEAVSGRAAEFDAKVFAERRAGLYLWDVYVGGNTSAITERKPAGIVDPMEPALILPDLTDPQLVKKVWYRGDLWWVDRDHTVLCTLMYPYPPLAINTNLVKSDEIKSYNDLLDPKWKGRMNINDPTVGGSNFAPFIVNLFGPDWLRRLAKNEPVIMRDQRLQGDWLVHGKVAVALGIKDTTYMEFKTVGAPIQVVTPAEGTWMSTGSSSVHIYNRQPHPNATKVFINWMLSKETQTILSRLCGGQSAREDVPTDFLESWQIRQPGVKYWEKDQEDVIKKSAEVQKLAKEVFGYLIK